MRRAITDTAILLGLSPEGKCVYSDSIPLGEYWDGEHVWDNANMVKKVRLQKLRGYLFDSDGELIQEFESTFDVRRGVFTNGWTRHADGTLQEHN